VKTLEKTVETVPWESETICFELWKNYPEVMKEEMPHWAMSPNENKRSMSMHGMENIADKNPQYILTFIGRLLDDESEEVQKKIGHILTQVGRQRPLQTYANIRRWLVGASEERVDAIWQTLRKLGSIFSQKNQRDKGFDFMNVTRRVTQEWKNDPDPNVAQMSNRLGQLLRKQ